MTETDQEWIQYIVMLHEHGLLTDGEARELLAGNVPWLDDLDPQK